MKMNINYSCKFWLGSTSPNPPFPWGVRDPHLTQCVIGPHKCSCQMASKSVEWFKQSVTDTDAREKYVAIGGIACAARSDWPRNTHKARICDNSAAYTSLSSRVANIAEALHNLRSVLTTTNHLRSAASSTCWKKCQRT